MVLKGMKVTADNFKVIEERIIALEKLNLISKN